MTVVVVVEVMVGHRMRRKEEEGRGQLTLFVKWFLLTFTVA